MFSRSLYILIVLIVYSCKGIKPSIDKKNETNENKLIESKKDKWPLKDVEPEIVFYVTQLGDTLLSLDEEQEVPIFRVLPDTISLAAVGDIMMGTNFPDPKFLPKKSGRYLWDDVRPILIQADITFGNLEGVILDTGGDQKKCNDPNLCYLFRTPVYMAKNLQENGFDILSLANNHANDFGKIGRMNTQKVLDDLGITHAGSLEHPFTIKKIGFVKVGFCAFAPNQGAISLHDINNMKHIISQIEVLSDIIVVSIHGGAEGASHQHITRKHEYYHGEDRGNLYELSHLMIDLGADLVLGHGPHVVRAIEVYKNRLIAYSLGNFLTYGRFNLRGPLKEAPILKANLSPEGVFLNGKIYAFRQDYNYGPKKNPNLSVVNLIRKLSLEDFPNNPIQIDNMGVISYTDHSDL